MAIYRSISQSFWSDTKVVDKFTPEDRYFMLYLLTNAHATLLGCYEISVGQMASETGYNRESIYALIDRFKNQYNIIDFSEDDNEILIRNWYRYNWSRSPKVLATLRRGQSYVKCERFRQYLDVVIGEKFATLIKEQSTGNTGSAGNTGNKGNTGIAGSAGNTGNIPRGNDTVSIGYQYGIDTVSIPYQEQQTPPTPTDTPPEKKIYGAYKNVALTDDELEEFKKAYPTSYEVKIDRLSFYMAKSGKAYQNHYAVLVEWAKEDEEKAKKKAEEAPESSFDTGSFYEAALARSYGGTQCQREIQAGCMSFTEK